MFSEDFVLNVWNKSVKPTKLRLILTVHTFINTKMVTDLFLLHSFEMPLSQNNVKLNAQNQPFREKNREKVNRYFPV